MLAYQIDALIGPPPEVEYENAMSAPGQSLCPEFDRGYESSA